MLPKLNNSGYYQSSCIFVRNEKKIKKKQKKTKQNKRRKGKRKEKKRKLVHKHYATLAWGNCSRPFLDIFAVKKQTFPFISLQKYNLCVKRGKQNVICY